jgi:predicted outer membrane protein
MRDRELAHCIINGNRKEVEVSKFALDKLQDAEIKQFAQKMIEDHSRAMQTFARFDPGSRATIQTSTSTTEDRETRTSTSTERNPQPDRNPPGDRDRTDRNPQDRDNDRNENRTGTQPNRDRPAAAGTTTQRQVTTSTEVGGVAKANLDWEQISDELTAQCIASAKRELGQKQGAEFEKAFLGLQVAAHMGMLDHLQVYQRHAGDELRAEIGKAVSTTQEHLQMAKRLMDEKKDTPSGAPSTDRDATRPAAPANPNATERRDDATP